MLRFEHLVALARAGFVGVVRDYALLYVYAVGELPADGCGRKKDPLRRKRRKVNRHT